MDGLLYAFICGLLIGLERHIKHKSIGLKTNTLICMGSALFMVIAKMADLELSRIVPQIITGVGFLGAGAIMHSGNSVSGLTTAAIVWIASAIGVGCGLGFGAEMLPLTIGYLVIIFFLSFLERRIKHE